MKERVREEIVKLFLELGLKKTMLNDEEVFTDGKSYFCIVYIPSWETFIIEIAHSLEEAEKNMYNDSDRYYVSDGIDVIIEQVRKDMIKVLSE